MSKRPPWAEQIYQENLDLLITSLPDDTPVYIKRLPLNDTEETENNLFIKRLLDEKKISPLFSYPYFIYIDPELRLVVTEQIPGAELGSLLVQGSLSRNDLIRTLLQIAGAIATLESQGAQDMDLNDSNIIIRPDGIPRIIDYGVMVIPGRNEPISANLLLIYDPPPDTTGYAMYYLLREIATGEHKFIYGNPIKQEYRTLASNILNDIGHPLTGPDNESAFSERVPPNPEDQEEELYRIKSYSGKNMVDYLTRLLQ
jgi:serine/threonine protein kinase